MHTELPMQLQTILAGQSYDFAIKAKRKYPLRKAITLLFFSIIWMAISGNIFVGLLQGKDFHITVDGVERTYNMSDGIGMITSGAGTPLLFPLIGGILLAIALYQLYAPGRWYISTPDKFIEYSTKHTRHIDWDNFNGDVSIRSHSITLYMRTGRIQKNKHSSQYVPDQLYIGGISNTTDIGNMIVQRIKEHDSNPILDTTQLYM